MYDSTLHPARCMDRPHIIYNKKTKKYVCWLKIMNKDYTQSETILTADHILGSYTKVRENLRPLEFSLLDIDWKLKKGSKIRVDISSSNYPAYHIHPNTVGAWYENTESKKAVQRIYCGGDTPSKLVLPIRTEV